MMSSRLSLQRLGPGLLYAAGAVGTSHLVQSTRAGADYGFGLLIFIVLIALIKYPAIRFGKDYAVATGRSLIHSYASMGRWVTGLYTLIVLTTVTFVIAALGLVVTGLLSATVEALPGGPKPTMFVLVITAAVLMTGKYRLLESVNKVLVPGFTLLIMFVTLMLIVKGDWQAQSFAVPALSAITIMYVVQLAGWLLTPMDASVVLSLWTTEKQAASGDAFSANDARFDFALGYWSSLVLAICFVIMGAGVLYGSGIEMPQSGGAFATQVIKLFSGVIGDWSFPVVALLALMVMYSTLLTVFDGYARNLEALADIVLTGPGKRRYEISVVIIIVAAVLVLALLMRSFTTFIDLVGALTFILGPAYAVLNHRAMLSAEVSKDHRPSRFIQIWSLVGIAVMLVVALAYVYLRWLS